MIRTPRGLAVLAAVALLLGIAALAFAPSPEPPVERGLVPDFDASTIERIVYVHPGADEPIELVPAKLTGWRATSGDRAHADAATVDATLSALRGGRWHRRADKSAAGALRGELRIVVGKHERTFGIGADLPGASQTWLVHDDAALLVDSWVARALLPEPLALRVRFPAAAAATARVIEDRDVRIERGRLVTPPGVYIADHHLRALASALAELEIVSLDKRQPGERMHFIEYTTAGDTHFVEQAGGCLPDRILIDSSYGPGCVERAAWERITTELDRYQAEDLTSLVEPRPIPFEPLTITFADGTKLDLTGRPRLGAEDADVERARELVAALGIPGTVVRTLPAGSPRSSLTVVVAGATIMLDVYRSAVVRRGEPYALVPPADALEVLARPASALRDPVRWREDALSLSAFTLDGVTYTRGAVLGEWTRQPAGAVDAALVDALVSSVATLRAPPGPAPSSISHSLRVTFTPPAGTATTHTIEIGAAAAAGCAARVDRAPVVVDLALCTAAAALASAR